MTVKTVKRMVSLSAEADKMLLAMSKGPPFHGRIGSISILVEKAIRQLYGASGSGGVRPRTKGTPDKGRDVGCLHCGSRDQPTSSCPRGEV